MITYSFGDVHGCLLHLKRLVDKCRRFAGDTPAKYIFLGDYIDRGPDSQGVVAFLIEMQLKSPEQVICLCGNHEDFLHRINTPAEIATWIANGGDATLQSYGVASPSELPPLHLKWLHGLPTYYDDGKRFFVHAGIDPQKSLDQQSRRDLLWIRRQFLDSTVNHPRLIVHGHSPTSGTSPDVRPNRVNVDTGAVFGGRLTAGVFTDELRDPISFFQV